MPGEMNLAGDAVQTIQPVEESTLVVHCLAVILAHDYFSRFETPQYTLREIVAADPILASRYQTVAVRLTMTFGRQATPALLKLCCELLNIDEAGVNHMVQERTAKLISAMQSKA